MNAADRASLIAAAKARATAVVSCVQARLSPSHVLDDCSRDDLQALIIVLAEAADPAVLRAVVGVRDDDGRPDLTRRMARLRQAHSQVTMLRRSGRSIPERLRMLDSAYRQELGKAKTAATGERDAA